MRLVAEITIAGLPPMTNNQRRGWKVRWAQATKWKKLVADQCHLLGIADLKLKTAQLTLTRFSNRRPDSDGLVSGFKSVIDSLTETGVIIDDKWAVIGMPTYLWCLTGPKKGQITIKIETIEP